MGGCRGAGAGLVVGGWGAVGAGRLGRAGGPGAGAGQGLGLVLITAHEGLIIAHEGLIIA